MPTLGKLATIGPGQADPNGQIPTGFIGGMVDWNTQDGMNTTQHYQVDSLLLKEIQDLGAVGRDYNLMLIDRAVLQELEQMQGSDDDVREFLRDMAERFSSVTPKNRHKVYSQIFEIYGEAIAYIALKKRGGNAFTIRKIPEGSAAAPDFECALRVEQLGLLKFFVEVKTFSVADADLRLPEMFADSMKTNIDIEDQIERGKRVAVGETEHSPHKRFGDDKSYDPRSVCQVIQTLIAKTKTNFKASQFNRGPTFALAVIERAGTIPQGANSIAPVFYDPFDGGSCVSGVFWNIAFGTVGNLIFRRPEFEGACSFDGVLRSSGFLESRDVNAAGLILLTSQKGVHLEGLFDSHWTYGSDWSDLHTESVMHALCRAYNDKLNTRAHEYSLKR